MHAYITHHNHIRVMLYYRHKANLSKQGGIKYASNAFGD